MMAAAAGIENYDGPTDDAAFRGVIADAAPAVQDVARAVRALVYDVLPDTVEVVWPRQRSIGWGIGPKKLSEQFAYLMPFSQHVTFGFYYGAELPDPSGLLPRSSRNKGSMRSMTLATADDVHRPELRALVSAAVDHLRSR
jgi:hypothetical protein